MDPHAVRRVHDLDQHDAVGKGVPQLLRDRFGDRLAAKNSLDRRGRLGMGPGGPANRSAELIVLGPLSLLGSALQGPYLLVAEFNTDITTIRY
jgi:hypothetical protein